MKFSKFVFLNILKKFKHFPKKNLPLLILAKKESSASEKLEKFDKLQSNYSGEKEKTKEKDNSTSPDAVKILHIIIYSNFKFYSP